MNPVIACSCSTSRNNIDEFPQLKDILPVDYKYTVCQWRVIEENHFESRFRVNISTKENAILWLNELEVSSNTTYTKEKIYPENTQTNLYKVALKCHHNTKPRITVKQPHKKHTNCPSRLVITVKQTSLSKKYKSRDIHLKDFPMRVTLRHYHNHLVDCADTVKLHPSNSEEEEKFVEMLMNGQIPSQVIEEHNAYLREMYDEKYLMDAADRSIVPDMILIYGLYYRLFRQEYGETIGKEMVQPDFSDETEEIQTCSTNNTDIEKQTTEEFTGDKQTEKIVPESQKDKVMNELMEVFKDIASKALSSDDTKAAAEEFIKSYRKLQTEAAVNSALHNFGKFSNLISKEKLSSTKRKDVQSMAVARKETPVVGCSGIQSGRPLKRKTEAF